MAEDSQKRAETLTIETYRENHNIDQAIAEAKKALDADPKDPEMTVTLAMLYGEKTETVAAMQLLQGLLQGNDGDQEIYVDIAQVQERGRKYMGSGAVGAEGRTDGSRGSPARRQPVPLGSIY